MLTTNENAQFQPMSVFVVPLVVNRGSPTQHRETGPLNRLFVFINTLIGYYDRLTWSSEETRHRQILCLGGMSAHQSEAAVTKPMFRLRATRADTLLRASQ